MNLLKAKNNSFFLIFFVCFLPCFSFASSDFICQSGSGSTEEEAKLNALNKLIFNCSHVKWSIKNYNAHLREINKSGYARNNSLIEKNSSEYISDSKSYSKEIVLSGFFNSNMVNYNLIKSEDNHYYYEACASKNNLEKFFNEKIEEIKNFFLSGLENKNKGEYSLALSYFNSAFELLVSYFGEDFPLSIEIKNKNGSDKIDIRHALITNIKEIFSNIQFESQNKFIYDMHGKLKYVDSVILYIYYKFNNQKIPLRNFPLKIFISPPAKDKFYNYSYPSSTDSEGKFIISNVNINSYYEFVDLDISLNLSEYLENFIFEIPKHKINFFREKLYSEYPYIFFGGGKRNLDFKNIKFFNSSSLYNVFFGFKQSFLLSHTFIALEFSYSTFFVKEYKNYFDKKYYWEGSELMISFGVGGALLRSVFLSFYPEFGVHWSKFDFAQKFIIDSNNEIICQTINSEGVLLPYIKFGVILFNFLISEVEMSFINNVGFDSWSLKFGLFNNIWSEEEAKKLFKS